MPPRPKHNKRRGGAGLEAWETVFESEFDFFGELADAGVEIDTNGRPSREAAKDAWHLHGGAFMEDFAAKYPNGAHFTPWAVLAFGAPR